MVPTELTFRPQITLWFPQLPPRDLQLRYPFSPSLQTPVGTPPLQNCEPIESKLRKQIQGCWRELLKECKEKDSDKQGSITAAEFLGLFDSSPVET